jgi:hypothetical protein
MKPPSVPSGFQHFALPRLAVGGPARLRLLDLGFRPKAPLPGTGAERPFRGSLTDGFVSLREKTIACYYSFPKSRSWCGARDACDSRRTGKLPDKSPSGRMECRGEFLFPRSTAVASPLDRAVGREPWLVRPTALASALLSFTARNKMAPEIRGQVQQQGGTRQ